MSSIWTHVGSACVPDESSIGKYRASSGRFMHRGSNTGLIYGRCNVTNPRDDGLDPDWNCLEVVYRREAETDRVTATLYRISNSTGGYRVMATFDTNDPEWTPDPEEEQTDRVFFHQPFNFEENAYYVEITVSRESSGAGHNPSVSIVRLYERME